MNVFVTGGTGFIGSRLIRQLLMQHAEIEKLYILVRATSRAKAERLFGGLSQLPDLAEKIYFIEGNLREPMAGVSELDRQQLKEKVDHFFHLGGIYDLKADTETQLAVNVQGTRFALQLATEMKAQHFHLVSSIAAAGLYPGVFREDMFDEAVGLEYPYFATKHESERIVRSEATIAYRIYRPGIVVGDSVSGETDKIDGPYYLFKTLKNLRHALPEWFPMLGIEGGKFNLVPVDFVVDALCYLAFVPGQDGQTFHLTDTHHWRFGDLLNLFAEAAGAPHFDMRINARLFQFLPPVLRQGILSSPGVMDIVDEMLASTGIPRDFFKLLNWPTRYDNRNAEALLKPAGICAPPLESYVNQLWDYWERHLDPDLFAEQTLQDRVQNKVVLITGGSSGIGRATAMRLAKVGAVVVICGRDAEKLRAAHLELEAAGGRIYSIQADITRQDDVERMFNLIETEFSGVDYLINNAGHSIRRPVMESLERLHDFQRTIDLNYLGSVSVTLKALPLMERRQGGHVINVSSIGVLSNSPRFAAYVASKAALEAFSRCAAAELADHKIYFSNINMPLVRTPMISPTTLYEHVPTLTPEAAAEMVVEAILTRSERVASKLGLFADLVHSISPQLQRQILNVAFRLFSEPQGSDESDNDRPRRASPSPAQLIFATVMKGVHW